MIMFLLFVFGTFFRPVTTTSDDPFADGVASQLISAAGPCDSHPCWNDGFCLEGINDTYTCLCRQPFSGTQCQFKTGKSCYPSGCSAEAFCLLVDDDVRCVTVRAKKQLRACVHNLCLNAAECLLFERLPRCFCRPTYHGTFCEYSGSLSDDVRGMRGSHFVIGLSAFGLTFVCSVLALLMCNCPRFTCYLLLPYRDYDRWRTADNTARSDNSNGRPFGDEFDDCFIPLHRLERMRITQPSTSDEKSYRSECQTVMNSETMNTMVPCTPLSPQISVLS